MQKLMANERNHALMSGAAPLLSLFLETVDSTSYNSLKLQVDILVALNTLTFSIASALTG